MAEFTGERSVLIQAPIKAVYEYVSDFPRHVEWNYQPTEMTKITDGPVGVGSVFRTKEQPPSKMSWVMRLIFALLGKLMGSAGYTEAEITALEHNKRVAWTAKAPLKNGSLLAKAAWEINLAPKGDGTLVTQGVHFQFLHKMGERMDTEKSAKDGAEEMARNLAYLKTIVETQASRGTETNRPAFA